MARVLVTGATGFIGQHLVRYLAKFNHDVVCLVRSKSIRTRTLESSSRIVCGDVTNYESVAQAVRDCDVVVNLAGVTKSLNRKSYYFANQLGAGNVAKACAAQSNPPVLIHISSLSAEGPSRCAHPQVKVGRKKSVSVYGKSKLLGEREVQQFMNRVPLTILRPPIVFGEGDRDVYPIFRSLDRFGYAFAPPYADSFYSFVHVEDLVQAIRLLALKGTRLDPSHQMGIYHVESEGRVTFRQFVKLIGQSLKLEDAKVIATPRSVTWFVGGLCEISARIRRRPFVMNLDKAREANAGSWACNASALHQIGYNPGALPERIQQTTEWYQWAGWINPSDFESNRSPASIQPTNARGSNVFEKQVL